MSILLNAVSGLNAANAGLTVTGHNVANANVEGFSRQNVTLATASGGQNGVEIISIDRIVNSFLNQDIWRTTAELNSFERMHAHVGFMEQLMGSESLNLETAVADIESAFNAAMTAPDETAFRQQIITSSQSLISKVNQINGAMEDLNQRMSNELSFIASDANSILVRIAEVNESITRAQALTQPTAELMDQREKLITDLSQYIAVDTHETSSGELNVSTLNGSPLIVGRQAAQLSASGTNVNVSFLSQNFQLKSNVGGQIGGILDAQATIIEPQTAALNNVLQNLADNVNAALSEGFDTTGTPGIPLFNYNPTNILATLEINPAITVDSLALGGRVSDGMGGWLPAGGVGHNGNIANVIEALDASTAGYSDIIGELAIHSQQLASSVDTAQSLNDNAIGARDSVSGVNLDEEAANLIQYQRHYEANARVINVADEMFRTLLNAFN